MLSMCDLSDLKCALRQGIAMQAQLTEWPDVWQDVTIKNILDDLSDFTKIREQPKMYAVRLPLYRSIKDKPRPQDTVYVVVQPKQNNVNQNFSVEAFNFGDCPYAWAWPQGLMFAKKEWADQHIESMFMARTGAYLEIT